MKAIARRQVDRRLEAIFQYRLDVNQIERIEPGRRLGFNENIDVAADAGRVACGRPEEVERSNPMRSDLRRAPSQFRQSAISVQKRLSDPTAATSGKPAAT